MLHILEGGYSDDLPDLIFAYLKGLEGKLWTGRPEAPLTS